MPPSPRALIMVSASNELAATLVDTMSAAPQYQSSRSSGRAFQVSKKLAIRGSDSRDLRSGFKHDGLTSAQVAQIAFQLSGGAGCQESARSGERDRIGWQDYSNNLTVAEEGGE